MGLLLQKYGSFAGNAMIDFSDIYASGRSFDAYKHPKKNSRQPFSLLLLVVAPAFINLVD